MSQQTHTAAGTDSNTATAPQPPRRWSVVYHNDDDTPMEYVIYSLQRFCGKNPEEAVRLTIRIHQQQKEAVLETSKAIAGGIVAQAVAHARAHQYPLTVTAEPNPL